MTDVKKIVLSKDVVRISGTEKKKRVAAPRDDNSNGSNVSTLSANKLKLALIRRIKHHKMSSDNKLSLDKNTNNYDADDTADKKTHGVSQTHTSSQPNGFSDALEYMHSLSSQRSAQIAAQAAQSGGRIKLPGTTIDSTLRSAVDLEPSNQTSFIQTPTPTHSHTGGYRVDTDIPYGCLRGGKKPAYKDWNKTIRHRDGAPILSNNSYGGPSTNRLSIRDDNVATVPGALNNTPTERELKLKSIQDKIAQSRNTPTTYNSVLNTAPTSSTNGNTIKHNTVRKKIMLGKSNKFRHISILIKDANTRKTIATAKKELNTAKIRDVKKYLRHHGIIRAGSTAPPKVLREMYTSSMLAGDVYNRDKEILMHNCLNEDNAD